jgi:hypothetical protein
MTFYYKLLKIMNLTVFFYSKYDAYSLDMLNKFDMESMNVVCVDNVKIREKILNDSRWNIKQVPCILKITDDGFSVIEEPILSRLVQEREQEEHSNELLLSPELEIIQEKGEDKDDGEDNEEEDVQEKNSAQPSLSISNIVQKMQKEREEGEKIMKTMYDD